MSLFVCAKCGCVDNTATSSYWMLTNEHMVDKFDYAKELQPYKGSSPTPIRRRRKTSGVSIWMWMILCINIITDNENKKDRMIIAYPSIIM